MNFWTSLPKPILALSPMDGVSDHPFRYITKKYGQPALVYTEFTSVEGVCHGAARLLKDFLYDETQRPVIGQIYGTTPDFFRQTAILLCEMGFDGIDINMGCPAKNVAHSGAGAALIKTPDLAQQIIQAVKQGISEWQNGAALPAQRATSCPNITTGIWASVDARHATLPTAYQQRDHEVPVSVKTRIGYEQPVVSDWIPALLATEPAAIAVHGRTLKQHYGGSANWDEIGEVAKLAANTNTLILGNGDVKTASDAIAKTAQYGLAGVLIGRATMGNPFVFHIESEHPSGHHYVQQTPATLFPIAIEHATLYEQTYTRPEWVDHYTFLPMRKHLGWYVHDVPRATEMRQKIYQTNSAAEFVHVLQEFGYATPEP